MDIFSFNCKSKSFRDNVHGYIQIPDIIVKEIIDTELMQRLQFIEQTSMGILFPAARHNRFIHSLGTYHLGVRAFRNLYENSRRRYDQNVLTHPEKTKETLPFPDDFWWKKSFILFALACLLHDVGHAPFSHTLEGLYEGAYVTAKQMLHFANPKTQLAGMLAKEGGFSPALIDAILLALYQSEDFHLAAYHDANQKSARGKPHEKMSAILIRLHYREAIIRIGKAFLGSTTSSETSGSELGDKDFEFMARMILGYHYNIYSDDPLNTKIISEKSIMNCIISLLNSDSLDVDSLDYISRDLKNSGMDGASLDYTRLLGSFSMSKKYHVKGFVEDFLVKGYWLENSIFSVDERNRAFWSDDTLFSDPQEGRLAMWVKDSKNTIVLQAFDLKSTHIRSSHYDRSPKRFDILRNIGTKRNDRVSQEIEELLKPNEVFYNFEVKRASLIEGQYTGQISATVVPISSEYVKYLNEQAEMGTIVVIEEYCLTFEKNVVSVIQDAIDARNQQHLWIYSHAKCVFGSFLRRHLLKICARYLCYLKNKNDDECNHKEENCFCIDVCDRKRCSKKVDSEELAALIIGFYSFFDNCSELTENPSFQALREVIDSRRRRAEEALPQEIIISRYITDDDLNALFRYVWTRLKLEENVSDYAEERKEMLTYFSSYFGRKHKRSLWKSANDFHFYFPDNNKILSLFKNTLFRIGKSFYSRHYRVLSRYALPKDELNLEFVFKEFQGSDIIIVVEKLATKELKGDILIHFGSGVVPHHQLTYTSLIKSPLKLSNVFIFGEHGTATGDEILDIEKANRSIINTLSEMAENRMPSS